MFTYVDKLELNAKIITIVLFFFVLKLFKYLNIYECLDVNSMTIDTSHSNANRNPDILILLITNLFINSENTQSTITSIYWYKKNDKSKTILYIIINNKV